MQVVGGSESTTTDVDGTFAFEVPMASEKIAIMQNGYEKKVKRITSGEMVIRTRKATKWFINASAHYGMLDVLPNALSPSRSGVDVRTDKELGLVYKSQFCK